MGVLDYVSMDALIKFTPHTAGHPSQRDGRCACGARYTKLVSTDGLDVTKGEVLVDVQVVENLVVSCAKGDVVRGFEGSQND
jgi:hypothetical protein